MPGVSAEGPCRAGEEDPLEHGLDEEQKVSSKAGLCTKVLMNAC